ncbi:MAG: cytochrome c biogenesis protein CcsA, partial [Acidimicrobiia bacterium]|nr:cytochrome c biogenesis protein CcsA [Acidimicrobiia bacterium]
MIGLIGTAAIATGAISAVWLVLRAVTAAGGDEAAAAADLGAPAKTLLASSLLAMGALEAAIVFNDFSIVYTANHHSSTTPFPFDLASAWAALEGSIVLWGMVLAIFTWFVARDHRANRDRLAAGALVAMGAVAIFFFGVMATIANPFETCVEAGTRSCLESSPVPLVGAQGPIDGAGPNALLQNHLLMAVHPPLLYIGYVGLTVPFAYAMSALALGLPGAQWLRRSQRWTVVAWSFLTL